MSPDIILFVKYLKTGRHPGDHSTNINVYSTRHVSGVFKVKIFESQINKVFGSKKTKGPTQDIQNLLRSHMPIPYKCVYNFIYTNNV